jgi:hypothetical protein
VGGSFSNCYQESLLSQLSRDTPLAFKLVCNDIRLYTVRDAVRLVAELTPEQRETYWWKNVSHALNSATKEPQYVKVATLTLQAALTLSGMLAQPNSP